MPKPAPRVVKLPGGGKIIPEHFHEGPEATRRFQGTVRAVLGVSRSELEKRQAAWEREQAKVKRRRKVG